jgi:hypothetical protein
MRKAAVAIGVSALIAGCGGGSSSKSSSAPRAPAPAVAQASTAVRSSCITRQGFGGLGGRADRFDANNNNTTDAAGPTPGAAFYQVDGTIGGCVASFSVQDSAGPPLRAGEMLDLVSRGHLPRDAKPVVATESCAVWKSLELRRAVGVPYARATAIGEVGGAPGSALIQATTHSHC